MLEHRRPTPDEASEPGGADSLASVDGAWEEANAGGSRGYPTWRQNPMYRLRVDGLADGPAEVGSTDLMHLESVVSTRACLVRRGASW
jgi:hypothetical protein